MKADPRWDALQQEVVDQTLSVSTVTVRAHPTRDDPAMMLMADHTSFSCWVEEIGGTGRWVFSCTTGFTYVGPAYDNEDSLEQIRQLLSRWQVSRATVEGPRP